MRTFHDVTAAVGTTTASGRRHRTGPRGPVRTWEELVDAAHGGV